jgi:hypothetical protein
MAEFKLGRIRFVWQGDWSTGRAYVADDVVSFGGKSYICIVNHTASAGFQTDFTNAIPKWDIVSDGTSWKGDWGPEVEYAPGDVVKYGSIVYIAETGHTSATFEAPDFLGLEEDLSKWTQFATSFDWKGDWTIATRFKINDLVKYGGYVYLCNTAHISAATVAEGLEPDQAKWTLFSDGIVYLGDWTSAVRYKVNDVVKYGGNVFIATSAHTSTDFISDDANWDVFIEGFQFEDSWDNSTVYQSGDTITYGGYVYVAKTNNTGSQPTTSPADWEVFTTGFKFQGDWATLDEYKVGDVVRLGGSTYVATADNDAQEPPNVTYWQLLNSGVNWTQSTESYSQISGTNAAGGSGSGAKFDITRSNTVYTVGVSTGFAGNGYADNDVITISGESAGGTTPANDIIITVTGQTGGVIDTITHTGYSASWVSGRNYAVGDVVIYGASSFIVVAKHLSEVANRPDNDLTAAYWNLLTLGSEALSLEKEGDLVYYGNQGPTRLPIGVDGQILRATDGFPDWANYGLIDNVIFVGPLGTDVPAPTSGLTIDKPFLSVSYALEQVKKGYLNPQTRDVLKNNKQFLLKEITNWLKYTYNVTVTSSNSGTRRFTCGSTANLQDNMPIVFTGEVFGGVVAGTTYYIDSIINSTEFRISATPGGVSIVLTTATGQMQGDLSYGEAKCERDSGLIIDALIYDVSRGGTLNTTTATKSYYTEAGNEYISSNLGNQRLQTIAANQQLKAIIATLLENKSPVNYQSLNKIEMGKRAQQVIDFDLVPEAKGKTKVAQLMDIVINGIAAESNTAIALPVLPNTTVFIKTGTYNETLPMILPEYTAVVGDELRTSVVQPAPAVELLSNDKAKRSSVLDRIKDVSSEIIQNVAITPTTGNTVSQAYVNGYGGNTLATNRINNGVEIVQDVLKTGLSIVDTMPAVGPTPTSGSNNASDAGFANAVAQIEANYDFIQEEIVNWIAVQVAGAIAPFASNFVYNAEKCKRDVEFILDALRYDLTYGGNFQSTVASRSYFVDGSPVYGAGEKEETLAAYAHLKTIVGDVITETPITPSAGNALTQNLDGTAGSAGAETFAEARVQEIYDTIDTDGTLASAIASDTTWVSTELTTYNTEIAAKKADIQNSVIDFVNSNFGEFEYDSGSCRRDSTILKTSSAYDTALGTNYNSIRDGLAYRRQMGLNVIVNQLPQTLGTIAAEKALVLALVSDSTATTRNTAYWDEVLDIVENGTDNADVITWSNPGVAAKTTAREQLQTNRAASIAALTTWIDTTYPTYTYSTEICERDAGRVIDAVSYDIQYGGNSATYEAAKAYFEGYAETLPVAQRDISAAAFEQLSTIVQSTMTNATEKAEANTLILIVAKAIEAGTIIALPTKTYPDYSWAAAAIASDADDIIADTTVVPATLQYVTNNYSEFEYDHAKCSRDIGFIVDGLLLDMMFGTTFNSLKSGMSYRRGITSTEYVLDNQLEASVVSLDVVREEIKEITSGQQKVRDRATDIINILANDIAPASYTITDPVGYDTGFFNARRLLVANKQFIIDEGEAYMIDNYNAVWTALTADEKTQWKAEIGQTVDALQYDLTYRGNLETIVIARKYYVDEVFQKPADEKTAFLALHTRLADVIDNIVEGNTAGWTKSSSNVNTQDVTGTAGSAGAGLFAVDRINEIKETIDSGLDPALITPATSWVDTALVDLKTSIDLRVENIKDSAIAYIDQVYPNLTYNRVKCARDVGYIVDAIAYDVIFNSNFRSAQAGAAYRRGITSTELVLNNQLNATIQTVEFIEEQLLELTMSQLAEEGTRDTSNRAYDITIGMQTIAQNGLAATPGIEFPTINEWGTSGYANTAFAVTANADGVTTTFNNAVAQIVANKDFMLDEIENWVQDSGNGFDATWAALTADDQARFITDIGYSIDAVRYDMIYGGNTQSLIVGSSYFTDFVSNITLDESNMTIGAYGRLKTVIDQVITETTVTTSPNVTETQDTSGTAANTNAVEFAQDRLDDVLDWLNNSAPNATIEVATDYITNERRDAYNELVVRKSEIVEDVVYWVEKYHQELIYNQDTCRRDAGLMVDAIARDIATGSNYATVKAGMQYYRPTASALEVVNNELIATVNSIGFLAEKVRRVACTNASASIELLVDDLKGYINGGTTPVSKWCAPSNADANDVAGAALIWENKKWLQAELTEYVNVNYPTLVYNSVDFNRDVSNVVDALRYDLTYGSTSSVNEVAYQYYINRQPDELTLTENQKAAYLEAFDYLKQLVNGLVVNSVTSPGAIQDIETPVLRDSLQIVGNAGTVARTENLLTSFYNILDGLTSGSEELATTDIASNVLTLSTVHNFKIGDTVTFAGLNDGIVFYVKTTPTPTTVTLSEYFNGPEADFADATGESYPTYPVRNADLSTVPAALKQQFTNLTGSVAAIKTAITTYIATNYPTLTYDSAKCERDVGLLVDAVGRDMMSNTNYLTTFAAQSYFRGTAADAVLGPQNNATVQAYRELKNKIGTYINANSLALKRTNNLMDIVIKMLDTGSGKTPEIHGTTTYYNSREMINAVDVLKVNREFLAEESVAWINANYGGTATEVAGSPGTITFSAAHNLSVGDPIKFATAIGGVAANTTYWVSTVGSTTTIEVSDTKGGEGVTFTGGTGSSVVAYAFDQAKLRDDVTEYVNAIAYDLQYPGNHKVWKEAQKYLNAVNGSERSDMFHVRNATGVRNMTVNGLRGNLTELNDFGTRRPTAGSYVSLDPGFGPWDTEAWVTNKSCYVQNVTTFGVGCVGCKIDGALHAGGNRSIVSNDFTQVLSDGIGVWCSGNNSLTELVSVFAYYNYSGYLADLGGRIRATNGNSSYGTYGVIAEGTDTGEIPITAATDNLSQDAIIFNVPTDGEEEVLRFEYANAGTGYTNAGVAISGAGFNAAVVQDEFRDQAVVEARLIDLDDGNGTGGEDYVSAQNVAQGGNEVEATLAATDNALGGAYVDMNLQLTAGTGVGQYGTILTFNNGTKKAQVYKPNSGPYTITATNATGNKVTLSGEIEQVYDNMPIYAASTVGGITENTLYYVINKNASGSEFELSTSEGGSAITLTTTTSQTVAMYAAGWNHVIEGTAVETNLDLTTGYRVEPRITFDEPGFTKDTVNVPETGTTYDHGAVQFADITSGGVFMSLPGDGTQAHYSNDGKTWAVGGILPASGAWTKAVFGGGQNARATAIVGGLGGTGAVLTAELGELNSIGLPGPTQIKKITVVDGGRGYVTAPTIVLTPTAGGGGASAVATVQDGAIKEIIITSTGAGYAQAPTVTAETDKVTEIIVTSFGRGYLTAPTITISGGGASTQATATSTIDNGGLKTVNISLDGDDQPLRGEGYTSAPTVTITDPAAKFVAISKGSANNAYLESSSLSTADWTGGSPLPGSAYQDIAYGNGTYVVVGGDGTSGAGTSTDGISWVGRTITTLTGGTDTFVAVAHGGNTFVAISEQDESAYSTNGITWVAGGALPPATGNWKAIAYGNSRYVALAESGEVAVSVDKGVTWAASPAGLKNIGTSDWNEVAYGQGLFVITGEEYVATSQYGLEWYIRDSSSASGTKWYGVGFGNPNSVPTWVVTNGPGATAARGTGFYINTGARALGRTTDEDGRIITISLAEPGSGYPTGTVVSTTAPNTIEVNSAANLYVGQPITINTQTTTTSSGGYGGSGVASNVESATGIDSEQLYYISAINGTDIEISLISGGASFDITTVVAADLEPTIFEAGPRVTIGDNNATIDAAVNPRIRSGALASPTFTNRGTGYTTATAELSGDGSADLYQPATFIAVRGLFELPEPGSNVEFASIPDNYYKLVTISNVIGQPGSYTATFQVSPSLTVLNAPKDGTKITTTNKYSQVRLTGHDFLYIGTGNQAKTNYPFVDITSAYIEAQQLSSGGGRVFFTSTDQDGNFNVGGLFGVQQSTGTATLDADAFNLAGLQSLQLGGIAVGIGSAVITQFSTDPFFTENSDNIVPTQRAIKSYITAQIGGGQSSLNVNTLTAGVIFIANDEITTTSGGQLNIKAKMNFTGGVDGAPVALGYFLSR